MLSEFIYLVLLTNCSVFHFRMIILGVRTNNGALENTTGPIVETVRTKAIGASKTSETIFHLVWQSEFSLQK